MDFRERDADDCAVRTFNFYNQYLNRVQRTVERNGKKQVVQPVPGT